MEQTKFPEVAQRAAEVLWSASKTLGVHVSQQEFEANLEVEDPMKFPGPVGYGVLNGGKWVALRVFKVGGSKPEMVLAGELDGPGRGWKTDNIAILGTEDPGEALILMGKLVQVRCLELGASTIFIS